MLLTVELATVAQAKGNDVTTIEMMQTVKSGEYVDGLLFPAHMRVLRRMADTAILQIQNKENQLARIAGRNTIRSISENCDVQISRWQKQMPMMYQAVDVKRAEMVIGRCHDMIAWLVGVAETHNFRID
jgi:hypothetical protein